MIRGERQQGYTLITVMMLLAVLMSMLLGYFTLTWIELSTARSTMDSLRGFYAAEAGLNVRARLVRQTFQGFDRPTGTAPDSSGGAVPCEGANLGSGDFACTSYTFQGRAVVTYVEESTTAAVPMVVPRGEPFQNLNGEELHYVVYGRANTPEGFPEAVLEMHFKSRLIPLFQFAAFYDKDLEILSAPSLLLAGPVHANGGLYLGSDGTLDITGQITSVGNLYHGRKDSSTCMGGSVQVMDPDTLAAIPACAGGRLLLAQPDVDPWGGMIDTEIESVSVTPPEALDLSPAQPYWSNADVRIVLDLQGATPEVEVREKDGTVAVPETAILTGCGVASHSDTLFNNREGTHIEMLELDVEGLLDCLHAAAFDIGDTTDGGMTWYLGVDGPDSAGINNYGVRVYNGDELASTAGGAPTVSGLTIVSNQAIYIQGDYNTVAKKPAAFLADTINVLSSNWDDAHSAAGLDERLAVGTSIQAAMLSATDTTGGAEGAAGQGGGAYNGGLESFVRFHEDWSGQTYFNRGSFVSLGKPRHVDGPIVFGAPQFRAPILDIGYDTDFEDAALLPPLSPLFVYLKQELFVRDFDL